MGNLAANLPDFKSFQLANKYAPNLIDNFVADIESQIEDFIFNNENQVDMFELEERLKLMLDYMVF